MKLADLLGEASTEELEHLAQEHAHSEGDLSRPQLLATIESVLRSYRFLQELLTNRQPPSFAIITLLLDAEDCRFPTIEFRAAVMAETERLCAAIESKEVLSRDDQLRVYRRVLYQARSNDALIDSAEAAILGVLRQELEIAQVEHFLIEHHADLREFWHRDGAFLRELHALRSAGIVYERQGQTLLASDLVPVIRRVLGLDMSRPDARRLYAHLSNAELHEALSEMRVPTSGSKDERIERLVAQMAQPRVVLRLRSVGIVRLRDLCRDIGASVSGSKDELVDRIIAHVAADRDVAKESEPEPAPKEQRSLDEKRFSMLFSRLRGHELASILGELDLRRWGSKDQQVRALWDAHLAETTLLGSMASAEIETLLKRIGLKGSGSKGDRIQRLLEHFANASLEALAPPDEVIADSSSAPPND